MKWTYSIKNRLAASIVLLLLCLLVLLSNYLDRVHTENVKNSISTMYEDRLIVEDYILKMTQNIYQIREIGNSDENFDFKANAVTILTADFKETYHLYSKTKLTATEKLTSDQLRNTFKKFENFISTDKNVSSLYTDQILKLLDNLSAIQLAESKLIMQQVESQYGNIKASSQLAFAITIVILIVLQVMVFSGDTIIPLFKPKDPSLN